MNWVNGKIVEKKEWTDGLYSLFIDAPSFKFEAGQFARLALEINGQVVARPYSFVNVPSENRLEFYIINVPGGELTTRLALLKSGDDILLGPKPAGLFVLSQVPAGKNLWLFATGTALGVFLSILKTALPWERFEKIVLVHAVRTADALTHRETIAQFQSQYPLRFIYQPFVSRESFPGALQGRVPNMIQNGEFEKAIGWSIDSQAQVMICGNPEMVKDTIQVLQARELHINSRAKPGQITIENYWKS